MSSDPVEHKTYSLNHLHEFCKRVFMSFGVPEPDAATAADVLQASDARGIDSHGVARMYAYHGMLKLGRINPTPSIRIVRETPSTATVDGDNGLGLVVGPKANDIAMEKAEAVGSGWVSVSNTNHYGIAGYYPLQALERDLIGWSMTNTSSLVAPLWGAERMLGTNPIAIAFPGHEEPPIVIDMATSAVPFGKIEIARRLQQPIPDGWAIDAEGHLSTDPDAVVQGGALLPLGTDREHGGHKGYCLSALVDILCSVLSGANWGPFAPPFAPAFAAGLSVPEKQVGKGIGHFFGALQIAGFIEPEEFKRQIDAWIRTFRETTPAPGTDGPLIPGDPEREAEAVRRQHGVPLAMPVIEDLRGISADTGVPFD